MDKAQAIPSSSSSSKQRPRSAREFKRLQGEVESLRAQLADAQETLTAIQSGTIDALVVDTSEGQRIFTLQGAEHAYRALIEQMREGALTLSADGIIGFCNRGFADMLARPLEQIIGTPASRYIVEADQAAFEAMLRQALGGNAAGELGFVTDSGNEGARVLPAQVGLALLLGSGPDISVSMVVTNLTERKQAEHVLASAQFSRRLIEVAPIGVAVVGRDLRYILANAAYQALAGETAGLVVGRTITDVLPPALAEIVEPAARRVLENGEQTDFREFEAQVNGRTWWNVTQVPLRDANGNTEAVLLLSEEVTPRMQVAEDLIAAKVIAEEARADAEAANKAKDHFLAVLSHELRNPLNPVLTIASVLREDPRFDSDSAEQLGVICRNAELATRLIDDMLDITRISHGKVELDRKPIDLCVVIRRAMDDCAPDIEMRELHSGLDLGAVPQWVNGDAGRLQQVFWNLLKNAIKFTPKGGHVGIRCSRLDGQVLAEVTDSGEGIALELLPRLFDAFEQGGRQMTRQFGGLGLGLTISKAIAEMHGGTMSAHSAGKGKGATFTMILPILSAEALPHAHRQPPLLGAAAKPLRILLVEDHGDTARIMRRVLSAKGHDVQVAGDVATALELASAHSFDLLLSDLGLPDGSGLDLMRELRAKGLKLPGIALSGYGQDSDLEASRDAGFMDHLVKPVNLPKLATAIAKAAGQRCKHSTPRLMTI